MTRSLFPFLFLALVVLGEWYGFQAVRAMVQHAAPGTRRLTTVLYWLLTVAIWALGIWAMSSRREHASFKSYFGGVLLAMLAAKIVIVIPLLLEDVVRLGRWAFQLGTSPAGSGGRPISRSEFLSKAALVAGAVPFVSLLWGMVKGGTDYTVKRVALRFPNLPAAFHGFKIVQISDLHTGSFQSKEPLQRAVALINQQQADLVFMTGDLVNNYAHEVEEHIDTLAQIQSKLPIFSILGNHDYADYVQWDTPEEKAANLRRLMDNHAKIGWRLMMDESHTLERNGEKMAILGVQNWGAKGFAQHGNLAKAHAASGDAPFKILLSHDPSHWDAQVHQYPDIDLTLSGHTHGMQFGVNLPFMKWSPVQYVYKQWAGLYQRGRQYLYVNAGLGFIGYPGRVGFLPEITVFELQKA
ncbi:metallophosphoesterase [Hymenobacter busanensis]|uniref:Metallophosphoesterase n=1 Tax=Hymenobacter busanensis TaxID=2607656 RepID=A0A7L4ZWG7_9BACT|nr:metallophosphoesterase [Hymenobacter busanensis]KAA9332103.1 metallophosphoesterase [Hymenobacter busanensis]QHJ07558.1 metallophosphoesterase [Hymenobacter busanensis]